MSAGQLDITIEQGADWSIGILVTRAGVALPLTGYSARMQIRAKVTSTDVLLSLTSGVGGGIDVGGSPSNRLVIHVHNTVSAAWTWRKGVYDLELIDGNGEVIRLLEGAVTVSAEVTR